MLIEVINEFANGDSHSSPVEFEAQCIVNSMIAQPLSILFLNLKEVTTIVNPFHLPVILRKFQMAIQQMATH